MVNDHYPYEKWLFHWGYTLHFQTYPNGYEKRWIHRQVELGSAGAAPAAPAGAAMASMASMAPAPQAPQVQVGHGGVPGCDGLIHRDSWSLL